MNLRLSAAFAASALALLLCGCPNNSNPDGGGAGGGNTGKDGGLPEDKCSGGCGMNQICDQKTRTCVDACGGCQSDGGVATCQRNPDGTFACKVIVTACSGVA